MPNKTCFDCAHMGYASGSPGYSEYTPGYAAEMYCTKSHWQYDAFNDFKHTVKAKLYMAEECRDFLKDTE
jgi:hypothetical protein